MKIFLLSILLLGGFTARSHKGINEEINAAVQHAFTQQFSNATSVKWTVSLEFVKADFMMNGRGVAAFYSHEGSLMGVTRNLCSTELPVELQAAIKRSYNGYWISELFELSNENGVTYFVTVENAEKKMVLQSERGAAWTTYQKQTK
jgi:hypothetical protein